FQLHELVVQRLLVMKPIRYLQILNRQFYYLISFWFLLLPKLYLCLMIFVLLLFIALILILFYFLPVLLDSSQFVLGSLPLVFCQLLVSPSILGRIHLFL